MRGEVIEDQLPVLWLQGLHLLFLDHPHQGLVPRFPVQALLFDNGQGMAGLALVEDLLPTRARGQSLPVLLIDAENGSPDN